MTEKIELAREEGTTLLATILMAASSSNLIKAIAMHNDNIARAAEGKLLWGHDDFMGLAKSIEDVAKSIEEVFECSGPRLCHEQ